MLTLYQSNCNVLWWKNIRFVPFTLQPQIPYLCFDTDLTRKLTITNTYHFSLFRYKISTTFHFEVLTLTNITKWLLVFVHRIIGCNELTVRQHHEGHRLLFGPVTCSPKSPESRVAHRVPPTGGYKSTGHGTSHHSSVRRCRQQFTSDFPRRPQARRPNSLRSDLS